MARSNNKSSRSSKSRRSRKSNKSNILIVSILILLVLLGLILSYFIFFKEKDKAPNINGGLSSNKSDDITKDGIDKDKDKGGDNNPTKIKPVLPAADPKLSEVIISSAGDCTIGTDPNFSGNTLPVTLGQKSNDLSYFFKNVKPYFDKDDLTLVNLETTFTTASIREPKAFNFKGDPSYVKSLTLGSIEAVNIANNHIYDFKDKGYQDTLKTLQGENINYFGEGNIYKTEIKGNKFAMIGYQAWEGAFNFDKLKATLSQLKSDSYTIIVNFHWGIERDYTPSDFQKKLAHFAIDNGADLIIGHHPHVLQGIETYKDKFICYSLGNFCFGGNSNPSDKDSALVQTNFKFEDDKLTEIGLKLIPCSISSVTYRNDYCPTPLSGDEYNRVIKKITKVSPNANFKLSNEYHFIKQN